MKKSILKPLSICLCATLIVGSVGATVYALTSDKTDKTEPTSTITINNDEENKEISKDETVYVLAGADGTVQKIIVSDWIKNSLGNATLNDKSELSNVENDAAIIYNTAKGIDLIICFMSENLNDVGAAQSSIANNSHIIYGYYNE